MVWVESVYIRNVMPFVLYQVIVVWVENAYIRNVIPFVLYQDNCGFGGECLYKKCNPAYILSGLWWFGWRVSI